MKTRHEPNADLCVLLVCKTSSLLNAAVRAVERGNSLRKGFTNQTRTANEKTCGKGAHARASCVCVLSFLHGCHQQDVT